MAKPIQYLYISNMSGSPPTIQSYSLFGESKQLPDVLHCETIAARSSLHDWELSPHRHGRLHQVLLLQSGGGEASLDGTSHPLVAGSLVNVPVGHVHAFRFQQGTKGWVTTLPDELLDNLLAHMGDVRADLGSLCVVQSDAAIQQVVQQIWQEFSGQSKARALVLRGLAATLLGWVARAVVAQEQVPAGAQESNIVQQFRELIEQHFLEHWGVADYAKALAVSPTHLGRLTRAATGHSSLRLIESRTMREARRHLAYTNLNIATIAYAMGYADPAHFSRVFTQDAGVSPRAFRQQLAK